MEVLELAGYTEEEKLKIAIDHLVDKQVKNHGLTAEYIRFTPAALRQVIRGYTREAGVRNLEREIGSLCRKVARRRAENNETPIEITPDVVVEMLGAPRFPDEEMEQRTKDPGVAIGLAWTPVGGEVLFIEASRMAGTGSLTLTGQLGDVMKESARAALSWLRAHAKEYNIDPDFFKSAEMHVHVPSGAIPKDGPSAGVTMAAAMASELTGRPVRGDMAMTGEPSGRVLPVGGIKERPAARRRRPSHCARRTPRTSTGTDARSSGRLDGPSRRRSTKCSRWRCSRRVRRGRRRRRHGRSARPARRALERLPPVRAVAPEHWRIGPISRRYRAHVFPTRKYQLVYARAIETGVPPFRLSSRAGPLGRARWSTHRST
jgi:hypothetical protein